MEFETFLNAISKISSIKYPFLHQKDPQSALLNLIKINLLPLHESLTNVTAIGEIE